MNICFRLELSPALSAGELVFVEGDSIGKVPLKSLAGQLVGSCHVATKSDIIVYKYVVEFDEKSFLGPCCSINLQGIPAIPDVIEARDSWNRSDPDVPALFRSSLFQDVILQHQRPAASSGVLILDASHPGEEIILLRLQVIAPGISTESAGRCLLICGSLPVLGKWKGENAVLCNFNPATYSWSVDLVISKKSTPFQYKFVVADTARKDLQWEKDPNRSFTAEQFDAFVKSTNPAATLTPTPTPAISTTTTVAATDPQPATEKLAAVQLSPTSSDGQSVRGMLVLSAENFHEVHKVRFRGAGVAISVFSLRSQSSLGIGEFADIKLLVDWARAAGLNVVQILPVNDTTNWKDWHDASPYAAISSFALHPLYVNIQRTGALPQRLLSWIAEEKKKLEKPRLDFKSVFDVKMRILRAAFEELKQSLAQNNDFAAFVEKHARWLKPYALFSVLRDSNKTCDFTKWGPHSKMTPAQAIELADNGPFQRDDFTFYYFLQYHAHTQLLEVSDYAKSKKIGLKGDLPIGVSKFCVDTWIYPEFFDMHSSVGAPPDGGNFWGQQWGLPCYNWDNLEKTDHSWWRERMEHMSQYFHAFRIDHVLAFFRVWAVPDRCLRGLMGRFLPALPIKKEELEKVGIRDMARLTTPYIRKQHLYDAFGARANDIMNRFFDAESGDRLRFKEWCNTEYKLQHNALWTKEHGIYSDGPTTDALYAMLDSVVMIPDAVDKNGFHPRMRMQDSRSFQELPNEWKAPLDKLFDDYCWKRQDKTWKANAMKLLPIMRDAGNMMACAEDLGMVPHCLPETLQELEILGLRVQRFPTGPEEFANAASYPYLTVCSSSTHDVPPIRAWWEQLDAGKKQRFFNTVLKFPGPVPQFCETWIVERIIAQHLDCPSMWAIFPIQDLMAIRGDTRRPGHPNDEQINAPDGGGEGNWSFRLHMNVDDLARNTEFTKAIRALVTSHCRLHE